MSDISEALAALERSEDVGGNTMELRELKLAVRKLIDVVKLKN